MKLFPHKPGMGVAAYVWEHALMRGFSERRGPWPQWFLGWVRLREWLDALPRVRVVVIRKVGKGGR